MRVPVELQNLPSDLEIVSNPPDTVEVRVRGPSGTLARMGPGEIAAVIDLRTARTGRRLFHLTPAMVNTPYGMESVQVSPATLTMEFETTGVRIVRVQPTIDGKPGARIRSRERAIGSGDGGGGRARECAQAAAGGDYRANRGHRPHPVDERSGDRWRGRSHGSGTSAADDDGDGDDCSGETMKLFGTDGIRGTAGVAPLDHATVARVGAALVRVSGRPVGGLRVLVGRDTRESGVWIERELARGLASEGAEVVSAGVIPTPAVAYLTPLGRFDAGIVISASHNPFEDNGIKVFGPTGEKLNEATERAIEAMVHDRGVARRSGGRADGCRARTCRGPTSITRGASSATPGPLAGSLLALDCANGATAPLAPALFRSLGFRVDGHRRRARRTEHQPELRLDAPRCAPGAGWSSRALAWASPSMGTAIARCSSTIAARSWTATRCCSWPPTS